MEMVRGMKTVWDVQQLLKRFGIYIYLGDRLAELDLMELELNELYRSHLIDGKQYAKGIAILFQAKNEEKRKKGDENE